ncbi:SRPBCC family protein, partial [Streptomyces cavourensis]|nr:SRPBCC family protein [Streptomyces cavourensis]
ARIAFDIRPWGERTLVIVDEHPLRGLGGTLHNPLVDMLLQLRHRTMLARLAKLVERVTPAGPDGQERTGVRTTG